MNIGITYNSLGLYVAPLIYKLMKEGDKPTCVICAEKSKIDVLKENIKKIGYGRTARKVLRYYKMIPSTEKNVRYYLRRYALTNNITNWNLPISQICKREGIDYLKVDHINSKDAVQYVKDKNIDILIFAGGGILRKPVLNAPKIGILNSHRGLLPAYRGMDCLEWSLFYGDKIGVTVHFMDQGIDTGDMLLFKETIINRGDVIGALHGKSEVVNIEVLTECIRALKSNSLKWAKQKLKDGKQYFVMHPRLKKVVESKLKKRCKNENQIQKTP